MKRDGWPVLAIHGDKSQPERDWVLQEFRHGKSPILVATDVASRGLDVTDIKFVINFDYPACSEDYVHRIGRTARATKTGTAYTFFTPANMKQAKDLIEVLREAHQQINPKLLQMSDMARDAFGKGRSRWGRSSGIGGGRSGGYGGGGGRGGMSGGRDSYRGGDRDRGGMDGRRGGGDRGDRRGGYGGGPNRSQSSGGGYQSSGGGYQAGGGYQSGPPKPSGGPGQSSGGGGVPSLLNMSVNSGQNNRSNMAANGSAQHGQSNLGRPMGNQQGPRGGGSQGTRHPMSNGPMQHQMNQNATQQNQSNSNSGNPEQLQHMTYYYSQWMPNQPGQQMTQPPLPSNPPLPPNNPPPPPPPAAGKQSRFQ